MFFLLLLSGLLAGCVRRGSLPPFDFQEPGWEVKQGQVIWRPALDAPELVSELLLAWRPDGRSLAQLTKTPFPLVTARTGPGRWELAVEQREFAGRGRAPARAVWLHLPAFVFAGEPLPRPWEGVIEQRRLRVENRRTGEFLEGWLGP